MKQYFLDTNLLIYANDRAAGDKQIRSIEFISRLMRGQNGVISFQVMREYANVALTKLKQEPGIVLRQLKLLESLRVVVPCMDLLRRQIEIHEAYKIGFWDAGIVAAAEEGHCDAILSEDFNEGQYYAGLQVVNPFNDDFKVETL